VRQIEISPLDASRFEPLIGPAESSTFTKTIEAAARQLDGRSFWHLNSTATGGGVAEILQSVLGYLSGRGISTHWAVVDGDDEFFTVTKRIHHFLHGSDGDGGSLGEVERKSYLRTLEDQTEELATLVRSGDVVVLHDPQTLGLAPVLRQLGAGVIWSCHVGTDEPNAATRQAWEFLAPWVDAAQRVVFSRTAYAWDVIDPARVEVIPPCIDAFSPKNQAMDAATVAAVLGVSRVVPERAEGPARFTRQDGCEAHVTSRAEMIEDRALSASSTLVTQISRWDPLKDHAGVMEGFVRHGPDREDVELVLAGPSPESVTDDPEGEETFRQLMAARAALPAGQRRRVHIACLPMDDLEQNAAIVNALQRRSAVVAQKSRAEGFGLTVTEAMWKAVPTVASAVGGIRDQVDHGVSGVLIDPPDDLAAFGAALTDLLADPDRAAGLGRGAHESVRDRYLAPRYLSRFLDLARAVAPGPA
jgi:trehalose synthase